MDDENVMIKCHELIEKELNDTTVISIGHLEWELCKYDYMIQLINDNNGRDYKTFKINWEMAQQPCYVCMVGLGSVGNYKI